MEVFSNGVAEMETLAPLWWMTGQRSKTTSYRSETLRNRTLNKSACGLNGVHLQDQLHHLSVDQAVDRFPVDVSDQIPLSQTRFVGWTALFYMLRMNEKREGAVKNRGPPPRQESISCPPRP